MSEIKIKRAIIAVYDKSGIADFARALVEEFGIEIISTGGTARHLEDAGIPVTMVEDVTGFPEMLDGRVKTLHPKIHAAILADRDNPEHMRQLAEQGIEPIDMVVVNLYPFEETIARPDCTFDEAIEMIDIGGPCMLRAAAKNHKHVMVVNDPQDYKAVIARIHSMLNGDDVEHQVDELYHLPAIGTFWQTMNYDAQVHQWLDAQRREDKRAGSFLFGLHRHDELRYGENPHQRGEVLQNHAARDVGLMDLQEDENALSFNNYVDGDAALGLVRELTHAGKSQGSGLLWHRRLAGDSGCGTGVSPVIGAKKPPWQPISDETVTRRNLPHIQVPGRTYFVTFRTRDEALSPEAREITLSACHYWHGRKMNLHIAIVMPDHVHLLLTPYFKPSGEAVPLGELLHSIKSFSSHEIRKKCGGSGPVWLDEIWDRVMRHEQEFLKTWEYIETNPDREDLGKEYRWVWFSQAGFEEAGEVEAGVEENTGETPVPHGERITGETPVPQEENHRRDAGATMEDDGSDGLYSVAFIKHANACGCAVGDDPVDAYRRAYLGDPIAAAGGVLCMNFPVTREFADTVMHSFANWGKAAGAAFFKLDVWIAPSFDDDAIELITTPTEKRKWGASCRLLAVGDMGTPPDESEMDFKKITGGMLVQTRDLIGLNEEQWKVVTKRAPTEKELADLRFAWLVCKHTKSNAITICRDGMLLGNGAGQMSRVKSCDLAIQLARENGHGDKLAGAVAAGDAFFPVPDGPQKLIDAGITAIIHPGGSNRDADTVAVCDAADVAMIVTGTRHFKH